MAALVQSFPQQAAVNMMQRPGSADHYRSGSASQMRHNPKQNSVSNAGYRGTPGPAPAYAFTSTPQLSSTVSRPQSLQLQQQQGHTRASSSSSSNVPQLPQLNLGLSTLSSRPPTLSALPAMPPVTYASVAAGADDSTLNLARPSPVLTNNSAKASPDRYRRNVRRTDSGEAQNRMSVAGQIYNHPGQSSSSPSLSSYQASRPVSTVMTGHNFNAVKDDSHVGRTAPESSRYRRRSLGNMESLGATQHTDTQDFSPQSHLQGQQSGPSLAHARTRPSSSHAHTNSSESMGSARSGRNDAHPSPPLASPNSVSHTSRSESRNLNVHARPSEAQRRNPSPLSRPTDMNAADSAPRQRPNTPKISSPAAEHLAALNQKEQRKPKSKLRRAFSFGSSAELRKATAQANLEKSQALAANTATANKRSSKYEDELEPEQARIAEKQEAAGLGESIYSGQGNFFTGSTDNLSISSTASSASIMLRKMGNGVKKGTRSFVGLFRPKSVLGVPAADGPVNQATIAQISMVNVEAEREKVNVNLDPHDHPGGGTGFPKLERNSIDNKMSMDSGNTSTESRSRRSIVGGERERADVLAAVKKGILKRTDSNQSSPSLRPSDSRSGDFTLRGMSQANDSPRSSAPSTPADEPPRSGHRRTDSITIETNDHDDYFSSFTRYASADSKVQTPLTASSVRNISFSPRIQFHDTWPSGEYDRRGEIATCNRLTPMLAQQIKEELNNFKMEMEVHESSKVYTHFF